MTPCIDWLSWCISLRELQVVWIHCSTNLNPLITISYYRDRETAHLSTSSQWYSWISIFFSNILCCVIPLLFQVHRHGHRGTIRVIPLAKSTQSLYASVSYEISVSDHFCCGPSPQILPILIPITLVHKYWPKIYMEDYT